MLSLGKQNISFKITLTLMACLALIFTALSWTLIENRQQALEAELFAKGQMAALVGAQTCAQLLDQLVSDGHIRLADVFDENYQLITSGELAGSDIPKYHTRYDQYLDEHLLPIQDAYLADSMVVYAVLVDRNGYLPTHNSRYSKPLTGDSGIDRVGNRTKRIFDDPVGLAAARFHQAADTPVLKQVYPRDTGVLMWDISAPVMVKGQHWGAFRIGFSMQAIDASVDQLKYTVIMASCLALLVCAFLTAITVGRTIRPLEVLTHAVQSISTGRLKEKIEIQSNDEIGVLVDAFNNLGDALEKSTVTRDFYDMLVQSMHDLMIVVDAQGNIASVNRATCEVLGCDEGFLLQKPIKELVKLRHDEHDWFSNQHRVRQNYTADVFLVNCQQQQVPMAMSCSPLTDAQDDLTGFILIFQDIRIRIKAEGEKEKAAQKIYTLNDEMRQVNRKMEKQNLELAEAYKKLKNSQVQILQQEKMASIGQLAAGVAHEINNPIGFITSNLSSLDKYLERIGLFIEKQNHLINDKINAAEFQDLQELRKKLKIDFIIEDSKDLLEESQEGAGRVKTIVQNLKTFSRIDQEQEQVVNLNECLDSTIDIAWNELKYKVTLEKDYAELPELNCHPQKLNQVFLNLLINAVQAIEEKGTISIQTRADENNIYIHIADTGSGIAAENISRIFEPFFTTKKVGKGTGLGMSISYEIIKEHGGELTVKSELGVGTTFSIKLPLGNGSTPKGSGRVTAAK